MYNSLGFLKYKKHAVCWKKKKEHVKSIQRGKY